MTAGTTRVVYVPFTYAATCIPPRKRTPRSGLLQGSLPFAVAPAHVVGRYVAIGRNDPVVLAPETCLLQFGRVDGDADAIRRTVTSALSFAGCDIATNGRIVGDERDMPDGSISDSRREGIALRITEAMSTLRHEDGALYAPCFPPVIETTFHRESPTTHSTLVVAERLELASRRAPNRIHLLVEDAVRVLPGVAEAAGIASVTEGGLAFVAQARLELAADTLRHLAPHSETIDAFSRGATDVASLLISLDANEDPGIRLVCSALRTTAGLRERLVARGPEADAADMDALVSPI